MDLFLVVDRVEGPVAVVEYEGQLYNIPRGRFREGQVYRWAPARQRWLRDRREETRRRRLAASTLEQLKASDPGGDITL